MREVPHSPHTGPWRSPCVSRTAALASRNEALAGGTALGMTWAIPWSSGSLPLWPRVPVTALKPLQAPLSSSPGPSSMGRLAPCLHPFWVRRPLLGCLRAPGTLGSPLVISTLPPTPPLSQEHPQGCPLPGALQGPPLSAPALKRGPIIRPSPHTPWMP